MTDTLHAFTVTPGMTVEALLRSAPLDPLENRILTGHALGFSRIQLITRAHHRIADDERVQLTSLFNRRLQGEPIAYITGEKEFYGIPFHVSPAVLIPRPETELLVDLALAHLPQRGKLLDLGTGSGAIAISVAYTRPDMDIVALDASRDALEVARQNAERHLASTPPAGFRLLQSNWYDSLGKTTFDVIVSNPPYIHKDDTHLQQGDLRFEPQDALTDHADGLSSLRTIVAGAAQHLKQGGHLFMEHGYDQALAVRGLLQQYGFTDIRSHHDLAGIERVSSGTVPM